MSGKKITILIFFALILTIVGAAVFLVYRYFEAEQIHYEREETEKLNPACLKSSKVASWRLPLGSPILIVMSALHPAAAVIHSKKKPVTRVTGGDLRVVSEPDQRETARPPAASCRA